ncbi:MAG: hypothetical protein R2761_01345 [Acidimicrobiales bacterium]
MTQHAEPHHDPRFEDRRTEADDHWTPPELGDQTPVGQQPDPERADWMPPPEHRPPSLLGDDDAGGDQPVRHDPTASMLPPSDSTAGAHDAPSGHGHEVSPPPGSATTPPPPPATPPTPPASGGPTAGTGGGSVGNSPRPGGAQSGTVMADPLWPDAEVARFEGRWREVQLGFVDDPRQAADEARSLLDEVMDRLTQAISDRRSELDSWRNGNGATSGGDDTEAMLGAVRRYRRLMDQLLAVGSPH